MCALNHLLVFLGSSLAQSYRLICRRSKTDCW